MWLDPNIWIRISTLMSVVLWSRIFEFPPLKMPLQLCIGDCSMIRKFSISHCSPRSSRPSSIWKCVLIFFGSLHATMIHYHVNDLQLLNTKLPRFYRPIMNWKMRDWRMKRWGEMRAARNYSTRLHMYSTCCIIQVTVASPLSAADSNEPLP